MIINHNIAALNTTNQLARNNKAANNALAKLSSGLRINSAADDAAGLAISEKMKGQINGLDQASRNAQDGISMVQTAEGALNETTSILQRMRELATQAANGTNTSQDRQTIQQEVNQLTSEVNRIGNTTQFNTMNLLKGGSQTVLQNASVSGQTLTGGTGIVHGTGTAASLTGNASITASSLSSINNGTTATISVDGKDYTISNTNLKSITKNSNNSYIQNLVLNAQDSNGNKLMNVANVTVDANNKLTITDKSSGLSSNVTFRVNDASSNMSDTTSVQNVFGITQSATQSGITQAVAPAFSSGALGGTATNADTFTFMGATVTLAVGNGTTGQVTGATTNAANVSISSSNQDLTQAANQKAVSQAVVDAFNGIAQQSGSTLNGFTFSLNSAGTGIVATGTAGMGAALNGTTSMFATTGGTSISNLSVATQILPANGGSTGVDGASSVTFNNVPAQGQSLVIGDQKIAFYDSSKTNYSSAADAQKALGANYVIDTNGKNAIDIASAVSKLNIANVSLSLSGNQVTVTDNYQTNNPGLTAVKTLVDTTSMGAAANGTNGVTVTTTGSNAQAADLVASSTMAPTTSLTGTDSTSKVTITVNNVDYTVNNTALTSAAAGATNADIINMIQNATDANGNKLSSVATVSNSSNHLEIKTNSTGANSSIIIKASGTAASSIETFIGVGASSAENAQGLDGTKASGTIAFDGAATEGAKYTINDQTVAVWDSSKSTYANAAAAKAALGADAVVDVRGVTNASDMANAFASQLNLNGVSLSANNGTLSVTANNAGAFNGINFLNETADSAGNTANGSIDFTGVPTEGATLSVGNDKVGFWDSSKSTYANADAAKAALGANQVVDINGLKSGNDVATAVAKLSINGVSLSTDGSKLNVTADAAGMKGNDIKLSLGKDSAAGAFNASFQIGANAGQSMSISINDMRAQALGISGTSAGGTITAKDGQVASLVHTADVTNGTDNNNTQFSLDLSTTDKASAAISVLDDAINSVSQQRSALGAYQNRLDHTINNLTTSSQNLTEASSRITDVNMAKEMMTYTKDNILQQAAQSMLAKANQAPQSVLSLLR